MTMPKETASNFELNILKLGIHVFQLVVGDRFSSNGATFMYEPCSRENQGKGKSSRYYGRSSSISAVKYKKDVERADNIEMIKDKFEYIDSTGKEHRTRIWEVKYAYTVEIEKPDNILYISLRLDNKRYDDPQEWLLDTVELEIKRETKENYFLVKSNPVTYHSQIPKTDMNIVHNNRGIYYIMGKVEDLATMEMALMKFAETSQKDKIEHAKAHLQQMNDNHNKLLLFKSKQGYI